MTYVKEEKRVQTQHLSPVLTFTDCILFCHCAVHEAKEQTRLLRTHLNKYSNGDKEALILFLVLCARGGYSSTKKYSSYLFQIYFRA